MLSLPTLVKKTSETGQAFPGCQLPLIIQIRGNPHAAKCTLAGAFADSAAQTDGPETRDAPLALQGVHQFVDHGLGDHFAFAQQQIIGARLRRPGPGRKARFGPARGDQMRQRLRRCTAGGVAAEPSSRFKGYCRWSLRTT